MKGFKLFMNHFRFIPGKFGPETFGFEASHNFSKDFVMRLELAKAQANQLNVYFLSNSMGYISYRLDIDQKNHSLRKLVCGYFDKNQRMGLLLKGL